MRISDWSSDVCSSDLITGAPVSTKAQAIYIEDVWNVTPNLLLNLGVRADKFENTLASGATFAKADFSDMISPRVGFSWDIKGDGTTQLFGNAGRYYLPIRSEEHTSELQSLMRNSYDVFCLKKKKT